MARKEHKTTPKVIWKTRYTATGGLPVERAAWFDWLTHNAAFYLESPAGTFTARRERRNGCSFWYAFRRQRKTLYKAYLGRSADLTHGRLLAVAQELTEKAGAGVGA